eukprot:scaffold52899_cov48-Phaeocystis_antarctica.AAC.2
MVRRSNRTSASSYTCGSGPRHPFCADIRSRRGIVLGHRSLRHRCLWGWPRRSPRHTPGAARCA